MSKVICYYHKVDLDGKCSAAIVRRKYPDCELIGVDYPDKPDFEKIKNADIVIVVDFSFETMDLYQIACEAGSVIWIDHHKSAIQNAKNHTLFGNTTTLESWMPGKREVGKAACELIWEYFFSEEPMPEAVRLLGRYDVWNFDQERPYLDKVLPFQYGMRLSNWHPYDREWSKLLDHNQDGICDVFVKQGDSILAYENQRNATYAKAMAFPAMFEHHKAWAINKALSNSKIFGGMPDGAERPLWILFSYKAGTWRYSLYSDPEIGIDVSEIATKYGGGGHAGAAGFQSDKYLLTEVKE